MLTEGQNVVVYYKGFAGKIGTLLYKTNQVLLRNPPIPIWCVRFVYKGHGFRAYIPETYLL